MPSRSLLSNLTPYLVCLLLIATVGPLLFGYHLAELNAPQEVITCVRSGPPKNSLLARLTPLIGITEVKTVAKGGLPQCIPMTTTEFGLVSSMFTLGGLVGALLGGPLTGHYGRLRSMQAASVFAAIGPVFEALAPNVPVLAAGRFVSGIGAGGATVIVPIYISEIAPPDQRGFFGTFTQVMVNIGILITQALGLVFNRGQLWRIILGVGGALGVIQLAGLVLVGQESPAWLARNGKQTKAKRILRSIRGSQADIDQEVSLWSVDDMRNAEDEEETLLSQEDRIDATYSASAEGVPGSKRSSKPLGFFAVFNNADARPAVIAIVMVMLSQQLLGINSIVMYGVGLLSDLLAANSAVLNVAVSALNIFVTICAAPLIEKAGRKTCLLASMSGMGVSSLVLAFGIMRHIPLLSALAVVCFVASFGLGLGPIPFILSSELVGAEAVAATQSWALATNWIATFVVAQFFPILNDAMGKGQVYFIFAVNALFFGLFTLWWVPETKGKKDADEVWGRKKSAQLED